MTAYKGGKSSVLYEADDEFSFGGGKSGSATSGFNRYESGERSYEARGERRNEEPLGDPAMTRYEQLQQQKQQSMNRQLEGTNRCLASIYDSERMGIATAEELLAQGEQLDNVERKLDKILVDTKTSQRHLNGIKSIFGGLKNWWTGEGKKEDTLPGPVAKKQSASLNQAMSADRETDTHPAFRLRSGDTRGFYDEDVVEFNPNDTSGYGGQRMTGSSTTVVKPQAASTGFQSEKQSNQSAEWREYEENLGKNLDLMSGGVARLKMLATGLGEEIASQNEQIEERIMPKTERADIKIRDQNRQMRQILGK